MFETFVNKNQNSFQRDFPPSTRANFNEEKRNIKQISSPRSETSTELAGTCSKSKMLKKSSGWSRLLKRNVLGYLSISLLNYTIFRYVKCLKHFSMKIACQKILPTEISWPVLERTGTTRNGVSNEFPREETKHQWIFSIPTKLLEKSSSWDRLFLRETGRRADKTFIYITCSQAGEASYKIAERNKRGASKGTHGSTRPAASPTSPLNRLVQVVAPGLKC